MGKIKIGILVLTDKVKDRMTRKNNHFDSLEFSGLKYIISEIDKNKYDVEYCSNHNCNNYSYVLVSLISYFDTFNFINQFKNTKLTTKIIIGGASVLNIRPLKKYIWAACFGRGETLINDIINQKPLENVWYKDLDPELNKIYKIGQLKKLIKIDNYTENSVGCPNKCFFCQYSWKHCMPNSIKYNSGVDNVEELFKYLNWETAKSRAISAIDGTTEHTRNIIKKRLSNKDILQKLKEVYCLDYNKPLYLKLFNIVGFPWEDESLNFDELVSLFKSADRQKQTHKVWVKIFNNHFKPMPLTPLELSPVSKYNYRDKFKKEFELYKGVNFDVLIGLGSTSPIPACEETIINRSYDSELLEKIYTTKKYLNLNSTKKIRVFEKYNPEIFEYIDKTPIDYIQKIYNYKHYNNEITTKR